jgi:hypothetical protein
MRRWIVAAVVAASVSALGAAPALADSTPGTGPPSQSCQAYSPSTRPGHSGSSPGAPFDEQGINTPNGGTGGLNYSPKSQYDVACFQWAQHHAM